MHARTHTHRPTNIHPPTYTHPHTHTHPHPLTHPLTHKHKQHKQHKHKQHTHLRNGLGERACSIEHVQELLCFGNMGLLPNKNQKHGVERWLWRNSIACQDDAKVKGNRSWSEQTKFAARAAWSASRGLTEANRPASCRLGSATVSWHPTGTVPGLSVGSSSAKLMSRFKMSTCECACSQACVCASVF